VRILIHCVYYPPEVGGLESHVSDLARGLVTRGHEVRVVTSRSIPDLPREEERDGVLVRRTWFPRRDPVGWTIHALGSIPATRRWTGWAQVLHAQAFPSVVPVGIAARGRRKPFVATFHTSHFLTRAERRVWRPILRSLVRWPDHALAASGEIARVAMGLAPGTRVEALTNGVETDRFRPVEPAIPRGAGVRRIVVPRRLFPKNGVEYLVRAMPRIREALPGTEALVVGDGPEGPRLRALARELGVEEGVRFLGARPRDEMPGLLCSGEVAVLPSLMEATSVAALEAMACELPVVATRVGGLPEIVDGDVGALVPPADPEGLARGVIELLGRNDLEAMGRTARERVVARWSNARLVDRHVEIYEALLEEAG
jgi:glycosyltransferase involved in cell wall biosynthesis